MIIHHSNVLSLRIILFGAVFYDYVEKVIVICSCGLVVSHVLRCLLGERP